MTEFFVTSISHLSSKYNNSSSVVAIDTDFLFSKKETGPELVVIYDFDERHLAGILANKADESLKEKLNLVDHLCENTF